MSDSPDTPTEGEPTDAVKVLRDRSDAAEARAKELEAQLQASQRELAFTQADVPNDGAGAWFRKAYDGEMTPDAITAAFSAGAPAPAEPVETAPTPTPEQVLTPQTVAQGLTPMQPTAAPNEAAAHIEAMRETTSQDDIRNFLDQQGLLMDHERASQANVIPLPTDMQP